MPEKYILKYLCRLFWQYIAEPCHVSKRHKRKQESGNPLHTRHAHLAIKVKCWLIVPESFALYDNRYVKSVYSHSILCFWTSCNGMWDFRVSSTCCIITNLPHYATNGCTSNLAPADVCILLAHTGRIPHSPHSFGCWSHPKSERSESIFYHFQISWHPFLAPLKEPGK